MKIAACQLPHVQKDTDRALALIDFHSTNAQREGAKLVCFPECFLQGYDVSAHHVATVALDLKSSELERILRRLEGLEPVIVLGLIEKDAGKFYNTAVVIARGTLVTRYRKTHLIGGERSIFERGRDYPVFDVAGLRVGINICCDLQFAESVEAAVGAGAELLVCPCNNMLRPSTAEDWKLRHNEVRSERARDARVWILSSDVTGGHDGRISYGPTAVIDPGGRVVAQVPLMTTGMVVVELCRLARA
jgi:predicted amidohydrolase